MGKRYKSGKPEQVFKFQRAAAGSENVLVYNKARDIQGEFPLDDHMRKTFGPQFKFYAMAHWNKKTGKVHISKFLPDQDW